MIPHSQFFRSTFGGSEHGVAGPKGLRQFGRVTPRVYSGAFGEWKHWTNWLVGPILCRCLLLQAPGSEVRNYLCNRMHTPPLIWSKFSCFIYTACYAPACPCRDKFVSHVCSKSVGFLWVSWRMWKITRDSGLSFVISPMSSYWDALGILRFECYWRCLNGI